MYETDKKKTVALHGCCDEPTPINHEGDVTNFTHSHVYWTEQYYGRLTLASVQCFVYFTA